MSSASLVYIGTALQSREQVLRFLEMAEWMETVHEEI